VIDAEGGGLPAVSDVSLQLLNCLSAHGMRLQKQPLLKPACMVELACLPVQGAVAKGSSFQASTGDKRP